MILSILYTVPMSLNNQKTLNDTINLSGVGLHNGLNANLRIKPAKECCSLAD